MPTPGKNFPGQRGFPTPNSTPDDTIRRIFVLPGDAEWLGLMMGAAEVLREEWRWYQWGELTPAEAAAAFNTIIIDAFTNVCPAVLPGGAPLMRVNADSGHVEEATDDGWQPPTGDATLPPIPPREDADPKCIAAANAVNVLSLVYEDITDSIAHGLTTADAYLKAAAAFVALVGVEFAPITAAIGIFFLVVFGVAYEVVQFIAADLWDEAFTQSLVCIFQGCATLTDGVVTFDWTCIQQQLAASTNPFTLSFDQLRLFGQITFIVQSMGGVDALDQAGATTAITDYDCDGCDTTHCFTIDFEVSDGSEFGVSQAFTNGVYVPGVGWQSTLDGTDQDVTLGWAFPSTLVVVGMSAITYRPAEGGADSGVNLNLHYPGPAYADPTVQHADNLENTDLPPFTFATYASFLATNGDGMTVDNNSGNSSDVVVTKRLTVRYTGDEVFGGDNC